MKFDTMMIEARRKEMRPRGYWRDELFTDHLDRCVAQVPDKMAIVDFNSMEGKGRRLNYRKFGALVDRIAAGLAELGIEKDDIVSCQLPNWWQFTALVFACWRIGAVINPMMPIFREREVKFMLGFAESKISIVPREYRGFDYPAMVRSLRSELPHLQRMLVIGGSGEESFERILLETPWEAKRDTKRLFAARRRAADDVIQVLYTSGTTGEPKGVMHTANTLLSNIYPFCQRLKLTGDDIVLMSSPMAHQSGFLYGLLMPVILRTTVVLQDIWNSKRAAELIDEEGATFTFASTPFLSDLTDAVEQDCGKVASLRFFVAAGAPIPPVLVERATKTLGATVISAWGMTENGAVTTTQPGDPNEKAFFTDGRALPGMEVQGGCRRRRPACARRRRASQGARLLQLRRIPAAAAALQSRRRGLVRYRGSRPRRCGRLYPHYRPRQGHYHSRR